MGRFREPISGMALSGTAASACKYSKQVAPISLHDESAPGVATTTASFTRHKGSSSDWQGRTQVNNPDDSSRQTMQLSLDVTKSRENLPSYPVADAIALVLILANFPNMLVTAAHLLFSLREHVGTSTSTVAPTMFTILLIDFVVVLFSFLLPSLQSTITDMSHVMIGVSLAGARWQNTLPFALTASALKESCNKVTEYFKFTNGESVTSWQNFCSNWNMFFYLVCPISNGMITRKESISPVAEYVKNAIAIHVVSLGIIRTSNYWISRHPTEVQKTEHNHSNAKHKLVRTKTNNVTLTSAARLPSLSSIWDWFLRWRAKISGRRYELTQAKATDHCNICVSEIRPKYVVFTLRTKDGLEPHVTIKVNGISWESKMSALRRSPLTDQHFWTIQIENLSSKTEYDIAFRVSPRSSPSFLHETAVCTTVKEEVMRPQAPIPAVRTAITCASDGQISLADVTLDKSSQTQRTIASLEESLAEAVERLEEKKMTYKKARKENAKRIQSLQRDLDHFTARMNAGVDKNEQRMQGRTLSLQTEIKRMQEAIEGMDLERKDIMTLISAQHDTWVETKKACDLQTEVLNSVRQAQDAEVATYQKKVAIAEAEATRVRGKAEKLSLRRTKIQQELDRISSEQDDILIQEYKDRVSHREALSKHRLQVEAEFLKSILDLSQRSELLERYL